MKIIENITLYKCEHCGKKYQKRFYCVEHEKVCRKNPINHRPCFSCGCLDMRTIEYGDYDPNSDIPQATGNALYCTKKEHFVYPPYVKTPYCDDGGDDVNEPMPKECTEWEVDNDN